MFTKTKINNIAAIILILTLVLSAIQPSAASAQGGDGIKRQVNAESGRISFIGPESGRALSASKALGTFTRPQDPAMALAKRFGPEFGLANPERDLSVIKSDRSEDGRVTVRYQQMYDGIPVMGGELIVNTNDRGDLYSMNGEVSPNLSLPSQPTVDSAQATETVLQAMAKWYQASAEDFFVSEPELWIYDESLLRPSSRPVELVWRMEVISADQSMPLSELVLVDAQRGGISLHFNQVDTAWTGKSDSTVQSSGDFQPHLAGVTWYVATTGDDTNDCLTASTPCAAIQAAMDKAAAGDTIYVASGTYVFSSNPSPNVVIINKNMTLSGGWDAAFAIQNGVSTIDGENTNNGILVLSGTIVVEKFVVQNSISSDSGAIYVANGNFTLDKSTLKNNTATNRGAGIFIGNGTVTVMNSTISGNNATAAGGGIYSSNNSGSSLTIRNSTIANNTAGSGGGIARTSGTVSIENTIISNNTGTLSDPDCSGTIGTANYNMIEDGTGCSITSGGNNSNVDPLIDPSLTGTAQVHALFVNSPAINAGDNSTCLSTDQLGMSRPQGNVCDIGAYELEILKNIYAFSGSDQSTKPSTSFDQPLIVYVTDDQGDPVSGLTVTFTAPVSGASGTFADASTNVTTAVSDGSGYATSSIFTANAQSGQYIVSATASGYTNPAQFTLANVIADLFVSTSGSDSNSCIAPSSPCLTINGAIGKSNAGDMIVVATGTYNNIPVTINTDLTLSGGWNSSFTSQTGFSTIDGNNKAHHGFSISGTNVSISRFIVQDSQYGVYHSAGMLTFEQGALINNYNGIRNINANTVVTNVTISGNNVAGTAGSAISNVSGTVDVRYSTITNNGGSYAIYSANGSAYIEIGNSILAGNTGSGDCYINNLTSHGYNIFGSSPACSTSVIPFVPHVTDYVGVDPKIYSLFPGNFHPFQPGSPALDAGSSAACPATDQRGVIRPFGAGCDIGAYEYMDSGPADSFGLLSGSNQRAGVLQPFLSPLSVYVVDAGGSPVAGVDVTFTAPASGASGIFSDSGTNTTTAMTNLGGVATASTFTANSQIGIYEVSATVAGLSGTVNFLLINSTKFVSPTGNDTNTCDLPSSPCLTINGAISKAVDGELIRVAVGTYPTASVNKSLTITGGWNNTFDTQSGFSIIDGGNKSNDGLNISGAQVSISRFIIQNSNRGIVHSSGELNFSQGALINGRNGIYNTGGNTVLTNVTISGHNASGLAGSAVSHVGGTLKIFFSTITNNVGSSRAVHSQNGYAYLEIGNSILAGNSYTNDPNNGDCTVGSGGVISHGYNIFGSSQGCYTYGVTFVPHSTDKLGTDPKLFSLLSNGLHPLKPGSPALDAANSATCPATDQRGAVRPVGIGCDIGALERSNNGTIPAYILAYGGAPQSAETNNAFSSALTAVVLDEYGDTVPGKSVTFTAPGSGASAIFSSTGTPTSAATTDTNGIAVSSTITANSIGGSYIVQASVSGLANTADFQLTNLDPSLPSGISIVSGSNQSAPLLTQFSQLLKAKVTNYLGQPLSGKLVTFTAPASGASGMFADTSTNVTTAISDVNGIATSAVFTSNNLNGGYIVSATVVDLVGSADFQLSNGTQFRTYTTYNSTSLPGTLLCTEAAPNCTNGSNLHADSAHKYAIGTYNLYQSGYGRSSIDNNNLPIISTVHFGNGYANAFWSGTQMVYGDYYGFPLADDVVAHELTHGVTQYESNLFYYYQSGAINESFSDLWGEYYDQTNGLGNDTAGVKWLMGEDASGLGALRSMSNPPAFGDPDKMSSTYYYEGEADNGGVHYNSGVNNKAVYLMVDGGTFNGRTVTALGWEKTGAIYYEAQTNLLISGSDYSDLYYALQQACTNLIGQHGITSGDCTEVKDAIDAVEMNSQPAPNFNTHAPLCDSGDPLSTVFFDDLETGMGNWTTGAIIGSNRWQYDSPYGPFAQSGQHSLYADDYPISVTDSYVRTTSPISIPGKAFMHFSQAFGFEDSSGTNYDGGIMEYSTNNGATWQDAGSLFLNNGYNGTIVMNQGNPLMGKAAFVKDSHGYISSRMSLQNLANQSVMFRWRMGLDPYVVDWGWWLDDIRIYTCDVPTFGDVPLTHPYNSDIEILFANGYTGGCSTSPLLFCPDVNMSRAQSAVFMLRGNFGNSYVPVTPTHFFKDNWKNSSWGEGWAESMYIEGLTAGCSPSPLKFCPDEILTNVQLAVFGLRLKHGMAYPTPTATGTVFADMTDTGFWGTGWAEQAYAEGLIPSCGTDVGTGLPKFCPNALVSRGFGASVIVNAKNLTMP